MKPTRNLSPIKGIPLRWSAAARKNRGMASEIARAGRFDWGVIARSSTGFDWAFAPPSRARTA